MEQENIDSTEDKAKALVEKIEWAGWRIASEISQSDNGSYFNEISNELSKLNLTLQEINISLKNIAEKD
tara:strand:- start:685 stop:891 length:207 start_codon:yes stop_codon:yes gene_type:complete